MKTLPFSVRRLAWVVALGGFALLAQTPDNPPPGEGGSAPVGGVGAPREAFPDFDGPPPFDRGGPRLGGPGLGGPGGPRRQETQLVKQFDKDGDGRLNSDERAAARAALQQAGNRGRGGFRGPRGGFGGRGESQTPPTPGRKLSPADVRSFPDAPVYDALTLRTFFLAFENADWEKELAAFNDTDVLVPATLTVDGRTYAEVGVHFRGNTSFMDVAEGRKRPLGLSLDFVHKGQQLGGYRTFNLLNAHEDPSFLRTVLFYHVAREYIPVPKANFVRVVINGECWGVYVNVEQVNKDFTREFLGTSTGARWKVPGGPGGRGGLGYLGEDVAAYRDIYQIKSKDDSKSWDALIRLCKVLDETPADQLEAALDGRLDVDGTLRFLALDNALVNNDGFWTRASDYYLCSDRLGCFHLIPQDVNETFSEGGGPGGPGGFGPGMFLAHQMLEQADHNQDRMITKDELAALAEAWFDKLDPDKSGQLDREQFSARIGNLLPPPQGFGPPGGGPAAGGPPDGAPAGNPPQPGRGRGGFGPAMFIGPALFTAVDADKDGSVTRAELKATFTRWFGEWDVDHLGSLPEEQLRAGLNKALPAPGFAGRGGPAGPGRGMGGFSGSRGGRGAGGFGGPPGMGSTKLDPLVSASDPSKPVITKLLAVPSLRARYLGYVRDLAETWLDWNRLGPVAQQYHLLIAEDVKADTRKLYSTEAFLKSLTDEVPGAGPGGFGGGGQTSLKRFADQRRAYLLNYPEVRAASVPK